MKRTYVFRKPAGLNRRVWAHCLAEARAELAEAEAKFRDRAWLANASEHSIRWAAENSGPPYRGPEAVARLRLLALEAYRYLEMRSHGRCTTGDLDPSARRRWETIAGAPILRRDTWYYDHTVHITSARRSGRNWMHPWKRTALKRRGIM